MSIGTIGDLCTQLEGAKSEIEHQQFIGEVQSWPKHGRVIL